MRRSLPPVHPALVSLGLFSWVVLAGCGSGVELPDLATVSGTITMDDQPLPGATVIFQPESGRPSRGLTDENGKYELMYTAEEPGAIVGNHTVRISTYREGDPDADDAALVAKQEEKVPSQYNLESKLTFVVNSGSNSDADFKLSSSGVIVDPDDDDGE